MRILLLTDNYPPEPRSSAVQMHEMAKGLLARGHTVTVVTGFPQYHPKAGGTRRKRSLWQKTTMDGVRVFRVWSLPYHGVPPVLKAIGQLSLLISFSLGGLAAGRQEAVIVYSPPLFLGLASWLLLRRYGSLPLVNVQDLFPKEAVNIGMIKNRLVIRFFEWMERFIYDTSVITVHSKRNRDHVLAVRRRKDPASVAVVPNWMDTEHYRPVDGSERERIKAELLGLPGKFVALFAGVMGFCQDIGAIVDAAALLRKFPDIHFLLLGDGVEKEKQLGRARRLGLHNVEFRPFVAADVYPEVLAGVDCGIATLRMDLGTPVIPSKILGFMAAAKPVVASLNHESDAIELIQTAACGICCEPGNPSTLAQAVLTLYRDGNLGESMGRSGRSFIVRHCTLENAIGKYEQLLDLGRRGQFLLKSSGT
jgi:colanic acid biosynthesis glycosyl transferase WcaI